MTTKMLSALILAAGLLSTQANAIILQKRTDGPARVIEFPIERKAVLDPVSRDRIRRRSTTVQATLDNEVSQDMNCSNLKLRL